MPMYILRFMVYNISEGQYEEVKLKKEDAKMNSDGRKHIRKVLEKDNEYLQSKHKSLALVMGTAEYKDPARKNEKPLTVSDIAEVKMDLVDFGKGRDIDEKF